MKPLIYQVFTRLYGNRNLTRKENGSLAENGSGKMADFTPSVLKQLREMGVTHVWYTGVIHANRLHPLWHSPPASSRGEG